MSAHSLSTTEVHVLGRATGDGQPYSRIMADIGPDMHGVSALAVVGCKFPNIIGNITAGENAIFLTGQSGVEQGDQLFPYVDWMLHSVTDICSAVTGAFGASQTLVLESTSGRLVLTLNTIQRLRIAESLAIKLGFTGNQYTPEFVNNTSYAVFTPPQSVPLFIHATNPPNLKPTDLVHLHANGLADGNMLRPSGVDNSHSMNVLCSISLSCVPFGQYTYFRFNSEEQAMHHFQKNKQFVVDFEFRDGNNQPILLPSNYETEIVLRLFHKP